MTTQPLIGDYASGGLIYSSGWVEAPSVIDVVEPATGAVLGHAGVGDPAGVDRAAAAADGGFGVSGTGSSCGGGTNLETFTTWQWLTSRDAATAFPF